MTFHFVIDNAVKMCVYYFQFQSFPIEEGGFIHDCTAAVRTASLALLFDIVVLVRCELKVNCCDMRL